MGRRPLPPTMGGQQDGSDGSAAGLDDGRSSSRGVDQDSSVPFITWTLAGIILAVAYHGTGFIPTEASIAPFTWSRADLVAGDWGRLFLSMFAHGGIVHLAVNLIALLSLGAYAERRLGHGVFLVIYLAAGIGGGLLHAMASPIPGVGASGAIFGLMGVMLILNPTAMLAILFLIPMPAVIAVALYVALVAFVPAFANAGNVAHMAHLGGMVTGAVFAGVTEPRAALRHIPGVALTFASVTAIVLWALATDFPGLWDAVLAEEYGFVAMASWPLLVWGGLTGLAVVQLQRDPR